MKAVAAIVDSDIVQAQARVRAAYSALREVETKIDKTSEKLETMRKAADARRLELGRALAEVRKQWPARGPNARGWGEFLVREGINEVTAWKYMQLAGYVGDAQVSFSEKENSIPTYAEAGIDNRPRVRDPDPERQPDLVAEATIERIGFDLRFGAWSSALASVGVVDTLITDAPFSARTHEGSDRGRRSPDDGIAPNYRPWTSRDVEDFVRAWSPRVRGWMVALSDDMLMPFWRSAYEAAGRLDFQPVPVCIQGMSFRKQGDGPSSWAVYAMVARPRTAEFIGWGTLPGFYAGGTGHGAENGRGKPLWATDRIVRDYSRPNDLVCDPLAGYGGTLISALDLGRRAVGAELDKAAFDEAIRRSKIPRDKPPLAA